MAVRFAAATDALGALVRERQDLLTRWSVNDNALVSALSTPQGQRDTGRITRLRNEIAKVDDRLAAVSARLDKEFPDFAALASPKPLNVEDAQALLKPDEGLVFWLVGGEESYAFALTREGFEWKTIPLGAKQLAAKVAAFRRGLDVDAFEKSVAAGKPQLFDLSLAHELYTTLLGPVEALVRDKKHLLLVPTGALTALPFHLLVTEKPAVVAPPTGSEFKPGDLAAYRDRAYLLKRHAVSVLPSVASLKALRVFASRSQAAKPMIGFGDPVFKPTVARKPAPSAETSPSRAVSTRARSPTSGRAPRSTARRSPARCPSFPTRRTS